MPRRKAAEVEILPPENDQPLQQVRHVKHKKEWVEVEPVEEAPGDTEPQLFDDDIAEEKPKRRVNTDRDQLRKKLAKNGVTPASQLKLTIEKYPHSDVIDGQGGVYADTAHCAKYVCTEAHLLNEDYLDVARKFGPGLYRFTLREKNQIVTAWDKRISEGASTGPIVQHANPNDPTSPQVIVNMPEGSQQPVGIVDPWKQMRELAKTYKELKQTFEPEGMQSQQQQQSRSEEEILASAILKQPDVIENVVGSVISRFGGKGKSDSDPWADVAMEAVKSGQAAQIVRVAIDLIFGGFKGLFPGGQQNGQAPMATTTVQNQTPQGANQQYGESVPSAQGALQQGDLQMGSPQALEVGTSGNVASDVFRGNEPQMAVRPEETALRSLIENCMRKVPVQVAFDQLIKYADLLNEQAPQYSIDGYIDLLSSMTTDQVIDFVKSLPGGEQVIALPHCREWCEGLQKLIQESQEGGEDA